MRRFLSIFFSLVLILFLSATALLHAQNLSPEQEDLLDSLRVALQQSAEWERYSQSIETQKGYAMTLFGGVDLPQWQTLSQEQRIAADYDHPNHAIAATIHISEQRSHSERNGGEPRSTQTRLEWVSVGDDVSILPSDDDESDLPDPETLQAQLAPHPLWERLHNLTDHTTAIFDLGVRRDANQRLVQGYELEFDFLASLPELDFDAEALAATFAEQIDPDTLTDALLNNGELRLIIHVDVLNGNIVNALLNLGSTLELSTDDYIFNLAYGQQIRMTFLNVGATFDITLPNSDNQ